jgi:hypothetical protein
MLTMRAITLPGWYVLSFICSLPLLANLWLGEDGYISMLHALCLNVDLATSIIQCKVLTYLHR